MSYFYQMFYKWFLKSLFLIREKKRKWFIVLYSGEIGLIYINFILFYKQDSTSFAKLLPLLLDSEFYSGQWTKLSTSSSVFSKYNRVANSE